MKKIILQLIILIFMSGNIQSQNNFPDWAKGIVWYQIFPERFDNGDPNNNPEAEKVFINSRRKPENWSITPWTSNWFAASEWEKKLGGRLNYHLTSRRYGGDLQGIINRLDYLKELGIKGLYLNPIFEAVSMHKYDGSSFHHIDVNFGPDPEGDRKLIASETPHDPATWKWTSADKLFLKLIEEVHKREMYIIIDGVFNHTGTEFWAFKDIVKNGKESKYSDWFLIKSFDDPSTKEDEFDWKGWWNHKSLPEFNRTENDLHPQVKQYVFNATEKWMNPSKHGMQAQGIDGWRLDVARDVPLGFWKDWSAHVKSINPSAIIIGELWEISKDFISEDGVFDALMNYNFAFAVTEFFINKKKKITSEEFINKLKEIDNSYPERNLHILQNLMSSHDTDRLLSMIINPDRRYDADAGDGNPNYNPRKPNAEDIEVLKLIAAFQMTYRGAPMLYYGDEIGMWGADDPHDRKPMIWEDYKYDDEVIDANSGFKKGFGTYSVEPNKELYSFYQKLITLRNESDVLKYGDAYFFESTTDDDIILVREYKDEKFMMVFNLGDKPIKLSLLPYGIMGYDVFTNEEINNVMNKTPFVVDKKSFRIFKLYN